MNQVVDGLVAEYEMAATGSYKWQKLVKFLQKSLAGPLHDLVKRAGDKAAAEYASLELQLRSMEEKVASATNQADAARRDSQQWKKQYEVSMSDYQKLSENSATQYANIQKKVTTLEERHTTSVTKYESTKKEATEWQTKYEKLVAQHQSDEERFKSDFGALQNRCSTAEARLAAMKEQSESAKEEAAEWKRKHEAVAVETKEVIERTISQKDKAIKQAQVHEDTLRAEFTATVLRKEEEAKDLQARIEQGERTIASLTAHMKEQELRTNSQLEELMMLRDELKKLQSDYESTKSSTLIFQKDLEKAQQERAYAEERMVEAVKRMEEAEQKRRSVQEHAKHAAETVEKSRNELAVVERMKLETQQLAAERLTTIERSERYCKTLEHERADLTEALEQAKVGQEEALAQARALELRFEEREREMENLLIKSHEQRAKTVEGFENLLMSERAAKVDASNRAEALSIQLQTMQADLDALQTQLMSVRNHETALDTKLKSYADNNTVPTISPSGNTAARSNKRGLSDDLVVTSSAAAAAHGSMEIDMTSTKRAKNGQSEVHGIQEEEEEEEEGEGHNSNEIVIRDAPFAAADYRKLTIAKLKQKLTEAGFGDEVVHLRTPTKKDLIALYEKVMVNV
jgi:chromosome segregation ATPase